jgi:hypothetical protein
MYTPILDLDWPLRSRVHRRDEREGVESEEIGPAPTFLLPCNRISD